MTLCILVCKDAVARQYKQRILATGLKHLFRGSMVVMKSEGDSRPGAYDMVAGGTIVEAQLHELLVFDWSGFCGAPLVFCMHCVRSQACYMGAWEDPGNSNIRFLLDVGIRDCLELEESKHLVRVLYLR